MKRVSDHNKTWNLPVLASRGSGTSSTTTKCVEQENAVQKKEPLQTQPRDAFPEYFYKPERVGRGDSGPQLRERSEFHSIWCNQWMPIEGTSGPTSVYRTPF